MKLQKYQYYFEPKNPITNEREFTEELIKYCDSNKNDLTIIHEGMEPIIIINGIKYIAMLEMPKVINIPFLPTFYASSYGFKWVYLYKYEN